MADTQPAPLPVVPGSVTEAQNAFLGLMEPEEEKPETEESAPTEDVEESTEETQDEPLEEVSLEGEEEVEEEVEEEPEEEESDDSEEVEELYAVTVNGEEHEVSLDELVKGYSRQSDYTRKTQEISEQRKEIEELTNKYSAEILQIQNERQQYIDGLQQVMQSSMDSLQQYANIDWEHLRETDPIAFVTKKDEAREAQLKVQQMHYAKEAAEARQAEEKKRLHQEALVFERKALVEKLPDWGNPEVQQSLASELQTYAGTQGFSEEELKSLIDHRSILVLRKAMLYDKANSSEVVKKKLKNKPKVVRAGSGRGKQDTDKSKRTASMKRLRQTGRPEDAASLFEDYVEL